MFKKILALGPHTDDIELGAGATLSRMIESNSDVNVAVFSTAKESLEPGSDPDLLKKECDIAMRRLGVQSENITIFEFPVRKLKESRQEVLEILVNLRNQIIPDCVLVPSTTDLHQDHQVLSEEGLRAFKFTTMLGYELPWNHIDFSAQAFIKLDKRDIENKIDVLSCYKSQIAKNKKYFNPDFISSLATVRGVQINTDFAESFEVLRLVL